MGKYFKISDAWDDLKVSTGLKETAFSTAKLLAKGVSNTVVYGVTEVLPKLPEELAKQAERAMKNANKK